MKFKTFYKHTFSHCSKLCILFLIVHGYGQNLNLEELPDYDPPKTIEGYNLIWNDEFNKGPQIDTLKWSFEKGFSRNEELQWYQSANATIKNGVLSIEAKKDTLQNPYYIENSSNWQKNRKFAYWTSSSLRTKEKASWEYGKFLIRARIDTIKGSWPAIWLLGNQRIWPENGEIDIMEFYIKNNQQSILANTAWKGDTIKVKWNSNIIPFQHFIDKDPKWAQKFHIWRMDWDKKKIRIYLDDELLNTTLLSEAINPDGFRPFQQPHNFLLNLAIGSNGGVPGLLTKSILYEVDYVRIYQNRTNKF